MPALAIIRLVRAGGPTLAARIRDTVNENWDGTDATLPRTLAHACAFHGIATGTIGPNTARGAWAKIQAAAPAHLYLV